MLDLSCNSSLQIDDTAVATIVQCSRLEALAVCKAGFNTGNPSDDAWERVEDEMVYQGYTMSQFSTGSWVALMQLPFAFKKRHGRELEICIDDGAFTGFA